MKGPIMVRRSTGMLIATLAVLLTALGFAASASAAPYANQGTVSVSTTNPSVGGTLTVGGSGFASGETVDLTLHSAVYQLGSTKADSSGSFSATVTLPSGVSGRHEIVATGVTSGVKAITSICIGSCSTAAGAGGAGSGGGGLASTGVAVAAIGGFGLILLIGGGMLLMAGRRRKAIV